MLATVLCGMCGAAVSAGPDGHCTRCLFQLGLESFDEEIHPADLAPILARPHRPLGVKFHRLGDYELVEEIARGGMGVVFLARQLSLNRRVALKLILGGRLASPAMVKRFQVEAEAAAGLHHPNIVAVYETGECEGHNFYSMELVEGAGLDRVLSRFQVASDAGAGSSGAVRERQEAAASLMSTLARAVAYAHQRGVLHRDIKPSNVLIDRANRPHLADFGLAKLMDDEGTDRARFTMTGAVLGTPSYMAPELASGRAHQATTAADVYSLGAIFYELLTGAPPFGGETPVEIWRRATEEEAKNPSTVNRAIDPELSTICLRCLEKDPAGRYESAGALADDLERWIADEPIAARRVGPGEKFRRWCRRKPAMAALALTALLATCAGTVGVWTQWNRAEREARSMKLHLYAADIGLAQQAMREGNIGRGRQLLDAYHPQPGREDLRGFEWRLLRQVAVGDYETAFIGHTNPLRSLAFSPGGRWLATAGGESFVSIWDVQQRSLFKTLQGHTGAVNCVAFSPDGHLLATVSEDQDIRFWDTRTWRPWDTLDRLPCRKPFRLAFSSNQPLLAYTEGGGINDTRGRVRVWNYETYDHCGLWTNVGNRLAFAPDGRRLITGGSTFLAARDVTTGKTLTRYPSNFATLSIDVSRDGRRVAACSFQGEVRVFNSTNLHQSIPFTGAGGRIRGVAFSPDGRLLAGVGAEQAVHLWNTTSSETAAQPPRLLRGHSSGVRCVGFAPDGRYLASGDKDGVVLLWDLNSRPATSVITNVFVSYTSAPPVFSANSRWMAAPSAVNEVGVWLLDSLECTRTFSGALIPLEIDANETLVTLSTNYAWQRWDLKNGREIESKQFVNSARAFTAKLSPDGRMLAVGCIDGSFSLWDARGKSELWHVNAHRKTIREFAFSPDGTQLGTASEDGTAKLWDIDGRRELATLEGHSEFVATIAFSPDASVVATGSLDHSVRLWSSKTGRELAVLAGHKEGVFRVAFTRDGRTLATASDDDTVRLWHLATHREVLRMDHGGNISTVGFTPDGERMVCSSHRQMIHLYRAPQPGVIEAQENAKLVWK